MFKKPIRIKNTSNLRSSDLRKLKSEVADLFNVPANLLHLLFPQNTPASRATLLESDSVLFSLNGNPLFVRCEIESTQLLVPTIYALHIAPTLLPVVLTHSSVASRLAGGADLMLPGVFGVLSASLESSQRVFSAWQPVQIVVKQEGKLVPVAVGVALMDSEEMAAKMRVSKGKACVIVSVMDDYLFQLGDTVVSKSDVGITVPAAVLAVEDLETSDDGEGQEGSTNEYRVPEQEQQLIESTRPETQESTESDGFVIVDKSHPSSSSSSEFDFIPSISERSDAAHAADEVSVLETESLVKVAAPDFPPQQVDMLLEQALIKCLKFSLPTDAKSYPLPATTLYSNHMLALLPKSVDVKQSSFKKLAKFLKAMEKKGYLKVKERQQGGELVVTTVYRNHPEVSGLDMNEKEWKKELNRSLSKTDDKSCEIDVEGNLASTTAQMEIIELFKSTPTFAKLWSEIGIEKDMVFTRVTLKQSLDSYISKKALVHPTNPRLIALDPFLASAVLNKSESHTEITHLPREALWTRVQEGMQPWHRLRTSQMSEPVDRRGSAKPIRVIVEKRTGTKLVTRVTGIEAFDIDAEAMAAELRVTCAAATSFGSVGGGGGGGKPVQIEVMVQGEKVYQVCLFLRDRYGFVFTGGSGGAGSGSKGIKLGVKGGAVCKWVEVVDKS